LGWSLPPALPSEGIQVSMGLRPEPVTAPKTSGWTALIQSSPLQFWYQLTMSIRRSSRRWSASVRSTLPL
jgi:hypothetical protein